MILKLSDINCGEFESSGELFAELVEYLLMSFSGGDFLNEGLFIFKLKFGLLQLLLEAVFELLLMMQDLLRYLSVMVKFIEKGDFLMIFVGVIFEITS